MTAGSITVVSGLCAHADGGVLMGLRRPDKLRPNLWELPGGKVEPGETHAAALRREWREELDIEIDVRGAALTADRLDIETAALIYLYRVELVGRDKPRCIDHVELQWVMPEHAVRHLPCSPGFYVQYRAIASAAAAIARSAS